MLKSTTSGAWEWGEEDLTGLESEVTRLTQENAALREALAEMRRANRHVAKRLDLDAATL